MADRLRPLTRSQAANCENAREPECKCRCGGRGHGGKRAPVGREDDATWYQDLPETDPHHLPSDAERRHLKRQRTLVTRLAGYAAMWGAEPADHPERVAAETHLKEARTELARIERVVLGMHRGEAPKGSVSNTDYDVWWCAKCDQEWTVPSRPHNPKCPTCGTGGWWRRFIQGPPYAIECGGAVEPRDRPTETATASETSADT